METSLNDDPEFTAVILAATCGARLFPISYSGDEGDAFGDDVEDDNSACLSVDNTNKVDGDGNGNVSTGGDGAVNSSNRPKEGGKNNGGGGNVKDGNGDGKKTEMSSTSLNNYLPKHLLPLVGRPILYHLLLHLKNIGFELCVVAIGSNDEVTIPAIIEEMSVIPVPVVKKAPQQAQAQTQTQTPIPQQSIRETRSGDGKIHTIVWENKVTIVVVKLPTECGGSADALRHLSNLTHDNTNNNNTATTTANTSRTTNKQHNPSTISPPILPPQSHIMILPADLILYGHLNSETNEHALGSLADAHRTNSQTNTNHQPILTTHRQRQQKQQQQQQQNLPPPTAVTMLLTDVSEYDNNGLPLKESAKAKKGKIARDDDEIEYIALSSNPYPTHDPSTTPTIAPSPQRRRRPPPRILLKQSKYSVEEDVENTASTPKLTVPKELFHHGEGDSLTIRTDWSDVHVFVLSPWVVQILHARTGVKDLAKELIPLLIKRQFRGVGATFGTRLMGGGDGMGGAGKSIGEEKEEEGKRRLLEGVLSRAPFRAQCPGYDADGGNIGTEDNVGSNAGGDRLSRRSRGGAAVDYPYAVAAKVLSRSMSRLTLRACTIPAYLYGCRETILHVTNTATTTGDSDKKTQSQSSSIIPLLENTTLDTKFNSVLLPLSTLTGDKVQIKSSTIGRKSKLGGKCRLNNVVVMDDVTVGDNCVLQNSVLANRCVVGDNCNLKECQVGAGYKVLDGTKATGECFFDG